MSEELLKFNAGSINYKGIRIGTLNISSLIPFSNIELLNHLFEYYTVTKTNENIITLTSFYDNNFTMDINIKLNIYHIYYRDMSKIKNDINKPNWNPYSKTYTVAHGEINCDKIKPITK